MVQRSPRRDPDTETVLLFTGAEAAFHMPAAPDTLAQFGDAAAQLVRLVLATHAGGAGASAGASAGG